MTESKAAGATIRRLAITNFRSIQSMVWRPSPGLNLILGGGDVGKTSILDAIALLLSPANPNFVPDTDYFERNEDNSFVIDAVIKLANDSEIDDSLKAKWPWDWNGTDAVVPSVETDAAEACNDPVYWLQVTGTPNLDLVYEIKQPDGTTDSIPRALRQQLSPVRLGGDDRNDRDLRFVQGSALDKLLSDKTLRSRLSSFLTTTDVVGALNDESQLALIGLNNEFEKRALPSDLNLAIIGAPGMSIMALIGLTALRESVSLPLSNWGAGTRRLAALAIAEQAKGTTPITLVDEIERGLEPYRQRGLVGRLQNSGTQLFVTTHSATAISAASDAALWYVDHARNIGRLEGEHVTTLRSRDPEAFLSRVTVVCEGITEVGFVTALLERALGGDLRQYGVHIANASGHESALSLLESLAKGGMRFGGFVDDEDGKYPTRWATINDLLRNLLFRWKSGCIEDNLVKLVPDIDLWKLLDDPAAEKVGRRLRSLMERLGTQNKEFSTIQAAAGENLRQIIIEAALGKLPAERELSRSEQKHFRSHEQDWFKSLAGGRELESKMFTMDLWPALRPLLLPFANAVRGAVGLLEVRDLIP